MSISWIVLYSLGCISLGWTLHSLSLYNKLENLYHEIRTKDKYIEKLTKQERDPWRM